MIHNCIHRGCRNTFEHLNQGRLYSLERRPEGKTEFFWLCPECESKFAVIVSPEGEVDVVPRKSRFQVGPPNPSADLRIFSAGFNRRAAA